MTTTKHVILGISALLSLNMPTLSAREHIGHCRTYWVERERDSQADINTKNQLAQRVHDARRVHGFIHDEFLNAKKDFEQSDVNHKSDAVAFEELKRTSGDKFREMKVLSKKLERETESLAEARILSDVLESLQTIDSPDFFGSLAAEMRAIDLSKEWIAPDNCPDYARGVPERCELAKTWYKSLGQELDQLVKNGLDVTRVISISPVLRIMSALQSESESQLRSVKPEIELMIKKRSLAVDSIKQKIESYGDLVVQLAGKEANLRNSLVEFDRAQTIYRQVLKKYENSMSYVKQCESEHDSFKIGKEKYRESYQAGVDC